MSDATDSATHPHLLLSAGPRRRTQATVITAAPEAAQGPYRLEGDDGSFPAQVFGGRLLSIVPNLAPGQERAYTLRSAPAAPVVRVAREGDRISVTIGDQAFTTLHLSGGPKPYLHPLLAPGGVSVVRGWPVAPVPGDPTDHPHHRGAWIGHGDVNGMDAWEERADRLGRIEVANVELEDGPVAGHVGLELRWMSHQGRQVATERRLYRFWAADGQARLCDVESVYVPMDGEPLRFGDTKEGALCGVRVAGGMEGNKGGRITTAEGAVGEREAWGSAAGWCDYSGVPAAEAAAGRTQAVGVAIFDHPNNPLHPTRWHVRDYGLMTANPFALSHYRPKQGLDGSWTVPAGSTASFAFRMCIHQEDAAGAEVARRYADWAFPLRARWEGAK